MTPSTLYFIISFSSSLSSSFVFYSFFFSYAFEFAFFLSFLRGGPLIFSMTPQLSFFIHLVQTLKVQLAFFFFLFLDLSMAIYLILLFYIKRSLHRSVSMCNIGICVGGAGISTDVCIRGIYLCSVCVCGVCTGGISV